MREQITLSVGMARRGHYTVEGLLGRSSSGATYLVRDQDAGDSSGNLFVLKEVVEQDKQGRRRLASIGKSLRKLQHPGLPRVHRVFKDDKNNRVYLLVDYIAGEDLETLRQQQPGGLFPWPQVMTIIAPLLAAVSYLHDQRTPVIHGDIRPANVIMSREDNRLVLVDIGLSKEGDPPDPTTPAARRCYLAPEQYSGGNIDARTDIYVLGATCYTLMTGKVPPDVHSRLEHAADEAIDPLELVDDFVSAVPAHVGKAIDRAMALDAQRRFSSVEQFREALWLLAGHTAPVFGMPAVAMGISEAPAPKLEESVGQAPENLLPEPPGESVPDSARVREDLDATIRLRKRPLPAPASKSVEELEDPDATIRLPRPLRVRARPESIEGKDEEETGHDDLPPVSSSIWPVEGKDQADQGTLKPIPRPSGDGRVSFSFRKFGVLSIVLALLISLGVGAGLMTLGRGHSAAHQAQAGHRPASPASTPVSTPVASSYPALIGTFTGTIYDIPANLSTQMSLSHVQQTRIIISGSFTGLNRTGTFNGTIDGSKHMQFTVKDSAGHLIFSFDGNMQSGGDLSGNYCSVDQQARCTGDYGIWSVAPES